MHRPLLPFLLFFLSAPAAAQKYSIEDIGLAAGLPGGATAVSESGIVVGGAQNASLEQHAFRWEGGQIVDLGTLGGQHSFAFGVNHLGQVVGSAFTAKGTRRAFLHDGSAIHHLGSLGGPTSEAKAVNGQGIVVGWALTGSGAAHAFAWRKGRMVDLHGLLFSDSSYAEDVNASGQVTGWTQGQNPIAAFVITGKRVEWLNTLGGYQVRALAISDNGLVTGWAEGTGLAGRPFLWEEGRTMPLGDLSGPFGRAPGEGRDVNNWREVVGRVSDPPAGGQAAFLHDGARMLRLEDLLPPGSGWSLLNPTSINDAGWIAGSGTYQGVQRAFVMKPSFCLVPPVPGEAGGSNTLKVMGAVPGQTVWFTAGRTAGSTPVPGCSEVVRISQPAVLGRARADASGRAAVEVLVPSKAAGRVVLFQAVAPAACAVTNRVAYAFP